ncbi:MAG: G5 domain-containing protein, partial [Eubacteriales bacterium]
MASDKKLKKATKRGSAGRAARYFLEFPGDYISASRRRTLSRLRRSHRAAPLHLAGNIAGWICCALLCMTAVYSIFTTMSKPLYICVNIDGENVGAVASVEQVMSARDRLESDISEYTGETYTLGNKITFTLTAEIHTDILDSAGCYNALNSASGSGICEAVVLYADGVRIGSAGSEDELYSAMRSVCSEYEAYLSEADPSVTDAQIISALTFERVIMRQSELDGAAEIVARCTSGLAGTSESAQAMSADDENADIGYGTENENASPDIVLRYKIVRTEAYNEIVKATTERAEDDSVYIGRETITQTGEDGLDCVTYRIESIDGEESERVEISRSHIVEMLPTVISVGTGELPDAVPTGTYIWPITGDIWITSFYGEQREEFDGESFHYGIDIDCAEGTEVMAADGGTVIYSATT